MESMSSYPFGPIQIIEYNLKIQNMTYIIAYPYSTRTLRACFSHNEKYFQRNRMFNKYWMPVSEIVTKELTPIYLKLRIDI
jgi:hypothetical protein